ncbi:HesA/MoeB/ThiF family protein [Chitinophaga sp.]|uniref:HesA/MoeB/ThiF family protein n=1 Tax=Chitinophaga sp. TaxID=1869181 RepID=UPI0031D77D11
MLSEKELERYKHPIAVPGMGIGLQETLKTSRILVIGAGGLGGPLIQYLSAAGTGVIGIADYGVILEEDLHRQPLFNMQDLRKHKAKMAASRLFSFNPWNKHYPLLVQVKPDNVEQVISGFDLVIDCSQHRATHLVVSDACLLHNKPFMTGEVHNWMAWWGGFNMVLDTGARSGSYRCSELQIDEFRNFDAGAMGATHGATALLMVNEVIKYLAGVPGLAGKLHTFDYLHQKFEVSELAADAAGIAAVKTRGLLTAEEYGLEVVPDVED